MDEILHKERIEGDQKVTWNSRLSELPHGTMFQVGQDSYAVHGDRILKWRFDGYSAVARQTLPEEVDVLTPRSVVRIFVSGFMPEFHPSAVS